MNNTISSLDSKDIMNYTLKKSAYIMIFLILMGWVFLFILGSYIPKYTGTVEKLSAQLEFIVHILILIPVFYIYKHLSRSDKKIFFWFIAINVGLLINDLTFYFLVYLKKTLVTNIPFLVFLLNFFPLLIWILSAIVFLSKTLLNGLISLKNFFKILAYSIAVNLIIIYLFLSSIHYAFHIFSWQSTSQIVLVCMQFLIFDAAIFCLIFSENTGWSYFLSGLTTLISGNLFVVYCIASQTANFLIYGELLWFLGLLLMMFGVWIIYNGKSFVLSKWHRETNSIKSRLVFWSFSISIGSFLLFFLIAHSFSIIDEKVLLGLPFFIMLYSMIVIIFAIFLGKNFETPFKTIQNNIKSLMVDEDRKNLNTKFTTQEFIFLHNFIVEAFDFKEAKNLAQKKLASLAAQVAHDIRSPLSALQIVTEQQLNELEEPKRLLLRNAVDQIRDIVNNLDPNSFTKEQSNKQIAVVIEHALSERRAAFSNKNIQINQNFDVKSYGLFVNTEPSELKRVIVNLINNSVDAIEKEQGIINVSISSNENSAIITITDNGVGISSDIIPSLFSRGFTTKITGSGLGLFHAQQTVSEWGGSIELTSIIGEGTTICISLPLQKPPYWFIDQLSIPDNSVVICVDDSVSIWHAWQERFKSINSNIELRYCNDKPSLLRELGKQEQKPCTYLVDYEFSGQNYTGLELIEQILSYKKSIDQVFLVTSRSGEEVQCFCSEHNISIISKFFALKIPVNISKAVYKQKLMEVIYD